MNANLQKKTDNSNFTGSTLKLFKTYKQPVDIVWERLKNLHIWKLASTNYNNFDLLGEKTFEVGTQYFLHKNNSKKLGFVTRERKESYNKKLVVDCFYNNETDLKFREAYSLFNNTSRNTTMLTYIITFVEQVEEKTLELVKKEFEDISHKNKKLLFQTNQKILEQFESSIIKIKKEDLWDILINFSEKFSKVAKNIADEVITEDKILKKNSQIKFIYKEKNVEANFKVTELDAEEKEKKWKLKLSLVDNNEDLKNMNTNQIIREEGEYYTPNQEILFELDGVNQDKCHFMFKHIFNTDIPKEDLSNLSIMKIKILKDLGKVFKKS